MSAPDVFDQRLRGLVRDAVKHYWDTLLAQGERQASGQRDAGNRSAVTGGAQLDGFMRVVRALLCEAGLRDADVFANRGDTVLPGFFRPSKKWDLIAVADGVLVACVEFKSQAGPSFGNNFNNRVEEALGNSTDFWKAYEAGVFRAAQRPFLGYVMLLEKERRSTEPVRVDEPHFPVMQEFRGASYARRYELFCTKLLRERMYDAAALLLSTRAEELRGEYEEPSDELSFRAFAAALMGRGFAVARQLGQ